MSIGERIAFLIKKKGTSNAAIAKAIGVSRPSVGNWIDGTSRPTGDNLNNLASELDVSTNYLLTGVESKLVPVEFWDSNTPLNDDEFEVPFFKDFLVSCGVGTIGEALKSETRKLRMSKITARRLGVQPDMTAAMTASGNSMSPKINDGDTVMIDTSKTTIKDGKIFAITHGGEFRFKTLYRLPFGGVRIVSLNSAEYPEESLLIQQQQELEFEVLGQIWSISSIEPL